MSSLELIASLGKIIFFLMVLFSFFLFTVKSEKKMANRIFAIFLLVTALDLSGLFLIGFFMEHPNFRILKTSSTLLQMPLFYFYVLSVCYSDFRIKPKYWLHGALFLLFVLVFKITSISERSLFYFSIVVEVQYFSYIFAVFHALKRYKTIYLENYSNADRTGYQWLYQVTLFFCFAHVFVLLKMGALFLGSESNLIQVLYIIISIVALFIICWFVLTALYHPQLFTGIKTGLVPVHTILGQKETETEKDDETLEAIQKLLHFMESEKPYLDFELTLEKLASHLQMPDRDLSILINHHLGKHFFDFINEYRIDKAKEILENPDNRKLTILEVIYQVGFNSKSSFYTAFKKITHQTPTAYRKAALSQ